MKGSFTEELVNSTIDWYFDRDIAFFKKAHVPTAIINRFSDIHYKTELRAKADIDYYGVYRGRYISFEVKETEKDYFLLSQLKDHQREILLKIDEFGAISFLLLNFMSYDDSVYLIKTSKLRELFDLKTKRIKYEDVKIWGINVPLSFPGIIDFLKVLEI